VVSPLETFLGVIANLPDPESQSEVFAFITANVKTAMLMQLSLCQWTGYWG
jgi:hypothetical protein